MSGILQAVATSGVTYQYATWDPANKGAAVTLSGSNLTAAATAGTGSVISTIGKATGKWYVEVKLNSVSIQGNFVAVALSTVTLTNFPGHNAAAWSYEDTANRWTNNVGVAYGAGWTAGDVMGIYFDAGAGTVGFKKNNSDQGQAYSGLSGTLYLCVGFAGATGNMTANFGATAMLYSPPAGYNAGLYT